MVNLIEKVKKMTRSARAFEAATRVDVPLPWSDREYNAFRENNLNPVALAYRDSVLNENRYEEELRQRSREEQREISDKSQRLSLNAKCNPNLANLQEILSQGTRQKRDGDYLLQEAAWDFARQLDDLSNTVIQQYQMDLMGRASEVVNELFAQPINQTRMECLLYCYHKMCGRIKVSKKES